MAATRLEWVLADFALARIGAVTAPIYSTSSAGDAAYMLGLVEAIGVFHDEARRDLVPALPHMLSLEALDELEERGRAYREEHPDALTRAEGQIGDDDLFTFIYTSGTTGAPKACMIRHRNYYEMAATIETLEEFTLAQDLLLLYLPLAHNYGRLLVLLGAYEGYTIAFLADPYATADALPKVRPTVLPSVPRLYEKVHARIKGQFDEAVGLRRRLIDWALKVGHEAIPYKLRDEPLPCGPRAKAPHRGQARVLEGERQARWPAPRRDLRRRAAGTRDRGVLPHPRHPDPRGVRALGVHDRLRGQPPRPREVRHRRRILPHFEVRTAEDGEVLIRSQTVFAGYYNDEEATREAIDADGWLHSGDIGEIDEDGYLRITDRKKDIIVTAGGKNLAPQSLENALKSSKLISQALVVGDRPAATWSR